MVCVCDCENPNIVFMRPTIVFHFCFLSFRYGLSVDGQRRHRKWLMMLMINCGTCASVSKVLNSRVSQSHSTNIHLFIGVFRAEHLVLVVWWTEMSRPKKSSVSLTHSHLRQQCSCRRRRCCVLQRTDDIKGAVECSPTLIFSHFFSVVSLVFNKIWLYLSAVYCAAFNSVIFTNLHVIFLLSFVCVCVVFQFERNWMEMMLCWGCVYRICHAGLTIYL